MDSLAELGGREEQKKMIQWPALYSTPSIQSHKVVGFVVVNSKGHGTFDFNIPMILLRLSVSNIKDPSLETRMFNQQVEHRNAPEGPLFISQSTADLAQCAT